MKKLSYIIFILTFTASAYGQNLRALLQNVEQHNPRLLSLQKWIESEEVRARTGIYPDDPEVIYNYLFGSPEVMGDQQEIEITQSFKLPGYYTSKSAVQKLDYQQKQVLLEKERREILHKARKRYFNLVWLQEKRTLLERRKEDAEKLVNLMEEGFEGGEISKPEYDKARLYATGIRADWQKILSDIQVQLQYLEHLAGGNPVDNLVCEYPSDWEPPVLDTLVSNLPQNSPDLIIAQLKIRQSEKEIKHQRMNSLPSMEAGYKSENILDQKLQGIHTGISIPLWREKNKVQYAKLQYEWSEANYRQKASELRTKMVSLYNEVQILYDNYKQLQQIISEEPLTDSYLQLLQAGQITFFEYVIETNFLVDNMEAFFLKERNYYIKLSELKMMFDVD